MKKLILLVCLSSLLFAQPPANVKPGIDVLADRNFEILRGKTIGLITNPTGVSQSLRSTIDILAGAKGIKLIALFGPEHGVRGDFSAGAKVDSYVDSATGISVYSLYGKTKKPTKDMLAGIDVLVYDIQDIGSRSYTYINTMAYGMEAAAEYGIEFVVLDRPNPLTGVRVEGNILQEEFKSFVGLFPIPYVYGLTCGELAKMINEEGWLADHKKCRLTVVPMTGWKRSMWWGDTGLKWVPTSPHVPTAETALFYAATGILGELDTISIGVGYTMPFQLFGAVWVNGLKLSDALNAKKIPGYQFRPISYKPFYGKLTGKPLGGVQVYIVDKNRANLTNLQFEIIETLHLLFPERNVFALSDSGRRAMFDKVMGTDRVRMDIMNKVPVKSLFSSWEKETAAFNTLRLKYLLYE
jgi:uncharacterized protein YbbC (DUF1343 family)